MKEIQLERDDRVISVEKIYRGEELKNMTLDRATSELEQAVYEASALLEIMEHKGKLQGSGHHARQLLCQYAKKVMTEQWKEETVPKE